MPQIHQRRLLHSILEQIDGVAEVYYQPPSKQMMHYPCLIYELDSYSENRADNIRYLSFPKYTLTLIDKDPESSIHEQIMDLRNGCYIQFNRFFTLDNLNHWVYTLTFDRQI